MRTKQVMVDQTPRRSHPYVFRREDSHGIAIRLRVDAQFVKRGFPEYERRSVGESFARVDYRSSMILSVFFSFSSYDMQSESMSF